MEEICDVDDTHTKLKKIHAQAFTDHRNTIDEDIQWTTEGEVDLPSNLAGLESIEERTERALAFLDTWSKINNDGSIRTKVFRKKTHTDQNLNFNSNHPLEHKRGVARTLLHHATIVVNDPVELQKEKDHIRNALHLNGYPDWVIDQGDHSTPTNTPLDNTSIIHGNEDNDHISLHPPQTVSHKKRKFPVVIPYIKGVSEELKRLFKRYEVPIYFKPTNTLRQLLVRPKR